MSNSKHTQGPWKVCATGSRVTTTSVNIPDFRTHGYGCGNDFIADLDDGEYHEYTNDREMRANARLIAAAPELLKELSIIEHMATPPHFSDPLPRIAELARVAIAKAEGREG
jgi:hypothetical protein